MISDGASAERDYPLALLNNNEIGVIEKILGSGGFCEVSAVCWIKLNPQHDPPLVSTPLKNTRERFGKMFHGYTEIYHSHGNIGHSADIKDGQSLASSSQKPPPRVALKKVKTTLMKDRHQIGTRDLLLEASVLRKCSHPNIISIYAVGYDDKVEDEEEKEEYFDSSMFPQRINFIMIDQLNCTLRKKISEWKANKGVKWMKSKKTLGYLWFERMMVIKQIADAIEYLHSKGFVHRDVTPDNIGFADDNFVKLFDFGLVKNIRRNNDTITDHGSLGDCNDQVFDLTSNTGTLRYMSPEVALGMPYGLKTDIYSFAVVIYEILKMSKFCRRIIEPSMFTRMVIKGDFRPTLDNSIPPRMQDLLRRMWSSDISVRPSSKQVAESMEELFSEGDEHLLPTGQNVSIDTFESFDLEPPSRCNIKQVICPMRVFHKVESNRQ